MTYTAMLSLTRAFLSDPTDPLTDPLVSGTTRTSNWSDTEDGEIRLYCGNVKKAVTFDSSSRSIPVTFIGLSQAQYNQLQNWRGTTLLLRTASGERIFGAYFSLSNKTRYRSTMTPTGTAYDVTITFSEVTYDESV